MAELGHEALILLATEYTRMPVGQPAMLSCSRELITRGLLSEAEVLLRRVLDADAACARAHELLACLFEALRQWPRAIEAWQRVLALDVTNVMALSRLGALYTLLGDWARARAVFERGVTVEPLNSQNLVGLAVALLGLEDFAGLARVRDRLLAQFPRNAHAHLIDGHYHKVAGQPDLAVAAYRKALSIDPGLSNALYNLVELEPPSPGSPLVGSLQALRRDSISHGDKANACFALARIFDSAKQHDEAFACYREGNQAALDDMARQGIIYDPEATLASAQNTIECYGRAAFGSAIKPLPIGLRMIFIVGLPRSGTSLIEQILASHPEVVGAGELPLAPAYAAEFEKRRQSLERSGAVEPADPAVAAILRELRERYLESLFKRGLDARYVTDKLPGNYASLGFIRVLFPDSVIVHCCRDALAVCWSLYTAHFGTHDPYYNSFEHLAHHHRVYRLLMAHWGKVLQPPMVEICYEQLAARPEVEIQRLVMQCGLDWHPHCLEFHKNTRPVFTASQLQVRRPIFESSIARWKNYEEYLAPLAALLEQTAP